MKNSRRDPASFRDPAGHVFEANGEIFRTVAPPGSEDYAHFISSGLAGKLQRDGKIVEFIEVGRDEDDQVLQLAPLPFVSYPYEWCFGQLRDAALLTLEVMLESLNHGMILKDASAFNVGWIGGKAVFIDHGSFAVYRENEPWRAYRQFVSHFLGPLLLMSKSDARHALQLRNFTDGLPLDYISRLLPAVTWFEIYPLLHVHLHARWQARYSDSRRPLQAAVAPLPRKRLIAMLSCLLNFIGKMKSPRAATEWGDYYGDTNYTAAAFAAKKRIVEACCADLSPGRVIDFGANDGEFSRIAERHAGMVVAADLDHAAVEHLYDSIRGDRGRKIHPVVQDLNNPSPGIGLFNRERKPFLARARGDLALGLALIHHLRIGANWSLEHIAELFAAAAPNALVEFVPKSDSQVQRLLRSRPDICADWRLEDVAGMLAKRYRRCETIPVPDSERTLIQLNGALP